MKALRKQKVKEAFTPLVVTLLDPPLLLQAFPPPLKLFLRQEFRRYLGATSDLWWDGSIWHRGTPLEQQGTSKGIPPELRIETDYQVEDDGLIHVNTDFYPSEYTVRKQRRKKTLTLPLQKQRFEDYLGEWNKLVTLDRAKILPTSSLGQSSLEKKVLKDYQQKRSKAKGPLRYKSFSRLGSIPILAEFKDVKPFIKEVIDFRHFISGRILKRSRKKYQVSFIYSENKVREVNLESHTLNFCRDPRLRDIGVAFSKQGISIVTQDAFDDRKFFIIKSEAIKNTKNFIEKFFNEINGKVRSIAVDASCAVPKDLVELRKKFVKKCRLQKAEGAAAFYEAPKLIPLGEVYRDDLPAHDPRHLKVWQKKLFKDTKDYALIQGLTGEHMLVVPSSDGPTTISGDLIPGLIMANHSLLQAMAKWDMHPGATFLSRASCRTASKGLNRN